MVRDGPGRLDIREVREVREPGAMIGKNYMGLVGHNKIQKLANDIRQSLIFLI